MQASILRSSRRNKVIIAVYNYCKIQLLQYIESFDLPVRFKVEDNLKF